MIMNDMKKEYRWISIKVILFKNGKQVYYIVVSRISLLIF